MTLLLYQENGTTLLAIVEARTVQGFRRLGGCTGRCIYRIGCGSVYRTPVPSFEYKALPIGVRLLDQGSELLKSCTKSCRTLL